MIKIIRPETKIQLNCTKSVRKIQQPNLIMSSTPTGFGDSILHVAGRSENRENISVI